MALMQQFHLTGMKYSIYDPMEICPHVHDKCCSLADEIKIVKFWRDRTEPMLLSNIDTSLLNMYKATQIYEKMVQLDPRMMMLKYSNGKVITPWDYKYCTLNPRRISENERSNFKALYEKLRKIFIAIKSSRKKRMLEK